MRLKLNGTVAKAILVSLLAMAACGSNSTDTSKFVGTWKFTSGTITVNCPGSGVQTINVTGNAVVSKGTASDLVVVDQDCSLKFDATNATTATARPSQACTTTGSSSTEVDTYSDVVFSTQDGSTGHLSASLTGVISSGGSSVTCTATESADIQKL